MQTRLSSPAAAKSTRQTIGLAERLYITEVDLSPDGDIRFPQIDKARWREARREPGVRGARDEADFVFVDYVRTS